MKQLVYYQVIHFRDCAKSAFLTRFCQAGIGTYAKKTTLIESAIKYADMMLAFTVDNHVQRDYFTCLTTPSRLTSRSRGIPILDAKL